MKSGGRLFREIPKTAERNLLRGTPDAGDWRHAPPPPPRPFHGKPIVRDMDDLARERAALTGQTPLEFLLEVMRDSRNSQFCRMEAAKAAAPYVHARLARIEQKLPQGTGAAQIVFLGGVLAAPRKPFDQAQDLELEPETVN